MARSIRIYGDKEGASRCVPEAERLLFLLKTGNINKLPSVWDNRYLADGSFVQISSIFGNDYISITSPFIPSIVPLEEEAYLIFLIKDADHYAVFQIRNNGQSLTPYSFDISKHIEIITYYPVYYNNYPSTCKTNYICDEHKVIISNCEYEFFYSNAVACPTYGLCGWLQNTMHVPTVPIFYGLRSSYIPVSVDSLRNDVFVNYIAHCNYTLAWESPAGYICSGRNIWFINDAKELISDIELWANSETEAQVRFKRNSIWEYGITLPYNTNVSIYGYFAMLSDTKFIGGSAELSSYSYYPPGIPTPFHCYDEGGIPTAQYGHAFGWFSTRSYRFSDVILEHVMGTILYGDSFFERDITFVGVEDFFDGSCYTKASIYTSLYHYVGMNRPILYMIDYDNLNIDDTFICFYRLEGNGRYFNYVMKRTRCYNNESGTAMQGLFASGALIVYKLAYRIKGGNLIKKEVCYLNTGANGSNADYYSAYELDCRWTLNTLQTASINTVGQRLGKVSCKVTEKYIIYSYTIEDYVNDTTWTFNKRILGIISIGTGIKTEYEVDDAFLGSCKDSFNEEEAAAIGLHILKKEV